MNEETYCKVTKDGNLEFECPYCGEHIVIKDEFEIEQTADNREFKYVCPECFCDVNIIVVEN